MFVLPVNAFVFFSKVLVEVAVQDGVGERVTEPEEVKHRVDDSLVTGDDRLHQCRVEVHEDVEEVEGKPRDEEDERDAQDHDVRPPSLFIVFGVLALKL